MLTLQIVLTSFTFSAIWGLSVPRSNITTRNDEAEIFTGGEATFFYQNGFYGACGAIHSDSDLIAAISIDRYGSCSSASSLCGEAVQITNTNNGKVVTVVIADCCPTCANENSMDLSIGAFEKIGVLSDGEVPIQWQFV